jgi:hypothetical protein
MGMSRTQGRITSVSHENAMPNGVPEAAWPHVAGRRWPSAPQPSPLDPFSDHRVASRDSQMTRRAVGMPCSSPPDGVITPPSGEPPGPSPSGGHEQHPGIAATRLTFVFQQGNKARYYWRHRIFGDRCAQRIYLACSPRLSTHGSWRARMRRLVLTPTLIGAESGFAKTDGRC